MDYTFHYTSPLGGITLASDGEALTGLWFDGQAHFGETLSEDREARSLPVFEEVSHWLDAYFKGENPAIGFPVRPRGTAFRQKVWRALSAIPYGETPTYGDLARQLGTSARAVGGAIANNPIALVIPCHRVMGHDGRMTGYAGGLDKKRWLLDMEKRK